MFCTLWALTVYRMSSRSSIVGAAISGISLIYSMVFLSVEWLVPDEPAVRLDRSRTALMWLPNLVGGADLLLAFVGTLLALGHPRWRSALLLVAVNLAWLIGIAHPLWCLLAPDTGAGSSVVYVGPVLVSIPAGFAVLTGLACALTVTVVGCSLWDLSGRGAARTLPYVDPQGIEWSPIPLPEQPVWYDHGTASQEVVHGRQEEVRR